EGGGRAGRVRRAARRRDPARRDRFPPGGPGAGRPARRPRPGGGGDRLGRHAGRSRLRRGGAGTPAADPRRLGEQTPGGDRPASARTRPGLRPPDGHRAACPRGRRGRRRARPRARPPLGGGRARGQAGAARRRSRPGPGLHREGGGRAPPHPRRTTPRPRPDHCSLAHRRPAGRRRRMGGTMIDDGLPSAPSAHHRGGLDRLGPPVEGPAQELIDSGFELENADSPLLHAGLNLADLAHLIDLYERGVVPYQAAEQLVRVLLRAVRTPAEDFPYDPAFGEPYNSRERYFTAQIGDDVGWLHAGRPRREAVRIALRLHVRSVLEDLVEASAEIAQAIARVAGANSRTWLPDQTYLQHAQPSTFGHYLVSFAYPVLRDAERLM